MPNFVREEEVPPLEVTLELLKKLEKVVLEDIAPQSKTSSEEEQPEYSIEIIDSFGTETLTTIDDYRPSLFPDTTSAVILRFASPYRSSRRIRLQIAFRLFRSTSAYKIEVTDDLARDVAVGIEDRLRRVLAPQRGLHGFLHPSNTIMDVALLPFLLIVCVGTILSTLEPVFPRGLFGDTFKSLKIPLAVSSVVYIVARCLRPYIIFDSRRAKVKSWLMGGVLAFVLITSLGTAVRRYFVGW